MNSCCPNHCKVAELKTRSLLACVTRDCCVEAIKMAIRKQEEEKVRGGGGGEWKGGGDFNLSNYLHNSSSCVMSCSEYQGIEILPTLIFFFLILPMSEKSSCVVLNTRTSVVGLQLTNSLKFEKKIVVA